MTPTVIFVYVSFAIGGVILLVATTLIIVFIIRYRRRQQQRKAAEAAAVKLSVTSSGSDVTDATRECDRRLTGSVSAPATSRSDVIWYSDESSTSSSRDVTSSSSAAPRRHTGDVSPQFPDDQRNQRLHRSSPLTALNSIYVDHVTSCGGGGVVNAGFVGDGVLTDSWRRVSWRARLRAGIARSTVSSDPGPAPATSRASDDAVHPTTIIPVRRHRQRYVLQ